MPVALITCPHCQRQIEAEEQQRGLRLRCPYPDCRKLFRWHPDGRCLPEAEPPRPATVVSEQFVYRDWRSQPPPRRTAQPPAAPVQEEVSVAVAEDAPVSLDELVALGLKPEQLRSQSSAAWWTALFFLGLLGMTGSGGLDGIPS
jgi:DNA-directed RNA polymerase subunit RPC12/RpoP